jgi:hypothetical protein
VIIICVLENWPMPTHIRASAESLLWFERLSQQEFVAQERIDVWSQITLIGADQETHLCRP